MIQIKNKYKVKGMPTMKGRTIEENNKKKIARKGEFWTINDKRARGHKSYIVKGNRNRKYVLHLPITHKDRTRNMKNKKLVDNPELNKYEDSYILPKVQKSSERSLGKKQNNLKIKNTTDKSVVRNIIKRNKKKIK